MKEKIKKYWWVIIIVLFIDGIFYWYEWRPSQIRKECTRVINLQNSGFGGVGKSVAEKEKNYEDCLREYGLEK